MKYKIGMVLLGLLLCGCSCHTNESTINQYSGDGWIETVDGVSIDQDIMDTIDAFMDQSYQGLAQLQLPEYSMDIITEEAAEAAANEIAFQNGMRSINPDLDYRLTCYNYGLTILSTFENDDHSITVIGMESSEMNFAQTPDVITRRHRVFHVFNMDRVDDKPKIIAHLGYDRLYGQIMDDDSNWSYDYSETYAKALEPYLDLIEQNYWQRLEDGRAIESIDCNHEYDAALALEYAKSYATVRNPQWPDYSSLGGNCQNFVSQSLYASGIPMDLSGDYVWKWFDEQPDQTTSASGRAASWTGVDEFMTYAANNTGYGLSASVDAGFNQGSIGDLIVLGDDDSWNHVVMISDIIQDDHGQTIDYYVMSNTTDLSHYPLSCYGYPNMLLIHINGWND